MLHSTFDVLSPAVSVLSMHLSKSSIGLMSLPRLAMLYPPVTPGNALLSAACRFPSGSREERPCLQRVLLEKQRPPLFLVGGAEPSRSARWDV